MPQELRVVCCFQCRKFQSDIVKKAKKWTCKLCGAQQSLVKEYARGSGRECRLLVQQLSDGSRQADQLERLVAEQVLSGAVELPVGVVESDPIREESDRLVASRQAISRKGEGDRGVSKWDSFCVKDEEDAEEGEVLTGKEKPEGGSWRNWGKGNVVDRGRKFVDKPGNSFAFKPRNVVEQPSNTSKLVPIVDFHQMDKQDKKQIKWQSKNLNPPSLASKPSGTISENKKTLFSFQPKTSKIPSTRTLEDIEVTQPLKRTSDSVELTASQSPMMSFAKKSKWTNFNRPEFELNSPIGTQDRKQYFQDSESLLENTQSPGSSSKWSKFIPQTDEEDDEFT